MSESNFLTFYQKGIKENNSFPVFAIFFCKENLEKIKEFSGITNFLCDCYQYYNKSYFYTVDYKGFYFMEKKQFEEKYQWYSAISEESRQILEKKWHDKYCVKLGQENPDKCDICQDNKKMDDDKHTAALHLHEKFSLCEKNLDFLSASIVEIDDRLRQLERKEGLTVGKE